jgi:hypothetical protein
MEELYAEGLTGLRPSPTRRVPGLFVVGLRSWDRRWPVSRSRSLNRSVAVGCREAILDDRSLVMTLPRSVADVLADHAAPATDE